MCDYDEYGTASLYFERPVTIRKPRRCCGCKTKLVNGTQVIYIGGAWDGDFAAAYVCKTCHYMSKQPEDSPFHACLYVGYNDDPVLSTYDPRWAEVNRALQFNETPKPDAELYKTFDARLRAGDTDYLTNPTPVGEFYD